MSKRTKEAQKHLQQKREQYHRQEEKIEEMKCTMQQFCRKIPDLSIPQKKNSYLEREHFERGKHTVIISGKVVKIYDGNHLGDINCHSCSNMRGITW